MAIKAMDEYPKPWRVGFNGTIVCVSAHNGRAVPWARVEQEMNGHTAPLSLDEQRGGRIAQLETYKEFCFELVQVYLCSRGIGKTAEEAKAGFESARIAVEEGLKENGLPALQELRNWYVERAKSASSAATDADAPHAP